MAIDEVPCLVFAVVPRFVDNAEEFEVLLECVKLCPCRHCGAHGTLIGHGFLRGYAERGSAFIERGRRFFCSNRGRKGGCGRTVSVLLAELVPRFSVTVMTLWALFASLSGGLSVQRWTAHARWPLSARSAYRIARRLQLAALTWRAWLSTRAPAPLSNVTSPFAQLKDHLVAVLGRAPLKQFQLLTGHSALG